MESDNDWQISFPRPEEIIAQPISRDIILLSGQTITSARTTPDTRKAGIAKRCRFEAAKMIAYCRLLRNIHRATRKSRIRQPDLSRQGIIIVSTN